MAGDACIAQSGKGDGNTYDKERNEKNRHTSRIAILTRIIASVGTTA